MTPRTRARQILKPMFERPVSPGEVLVCNSVTDLAERVERYELALHGIAGHGNITGEKAREIASKALGIQKPE